MSKLSKAFFLLTDDDKNKILQLARDENLGIQKIAEEKDLSPKTVGEVLRSFNFDRKKHHAAQNKARVEREFVGKRIGYCQLGKVIGGDYANLNTIVMEMTCHGTQHRHGKSFPCDSGKNTIKLRSILENPNWKNLSCGCMHPERLKNVARYRALRM